MFGANPDLVDAYRFSMAGPASGLGAVMAKIAQSAPHEVAAMHLKALIASRLQQPNQQVALTEVMMGLKMWLKNPSGQTLGLPVIKALAQVLEQTPAVLRPGTLAREPFSGASNAFRASVFEAALLLASHHPQVLEPIARAWSVQWTPEMAAQLAGEVLRCIGRGIAPLDDGRGAMLSIGALEAMRLSGWDVGLSFFPAGAGARKYIFDYVPSGDGVNARQLQLNGFFNVHLLGAVERDVPFGNFPAVHAAVSEGRVDVLDALLTEGYDPNGVIVAKDSPHKGCTPLLLAIRLGQVECAARLLEMGADPHWPMPDGRQPVQMAADSPQLCALIKSRIAQIELLKNFDESAEGIGRTMDLFGQKKRGFGI